MKILYAITSLAHKRVIEPFDEISGINQMVVGPKATIIDNIVPEDYSDLKIKSVKQYTSVQEIQKYVNEFNPNFFIQADLSPDTKRIKLPVKCKRIYVSHGMVGNHLIDISKSANIDSSVWKGLDYYCGGTKFFEKWVMYAAGVGKNKIGLNMVPQFDTLYDVEHQELWKKRILNRTKNPSPSKVLFFGGFCCKDRKDFLDHNEDFFISCIKLEELARKNNWLVFIKPRQEYSKIIDFLNRHKKDWGGWTKKYINKYAEIQNSKFLHFINTSCGLHYYYFASDAIVLNGCSTIEMEAHVINKPCIIINTKKVIDIFGSERYNVSFKVQDINTLEDTVNKSIEEAASIKYKQSNEKFLQDLGLTIDGKMTQRIINKILSGEIK